MLILKSNRETGEVVWTYLHESDLETEVTQFNQYRIYLHYDTKDRQRFMWLGTIKNTVNVIKFDKYNANSIW